MTPTEGRVIPAAGFASIERVRVVVLSSRIRSSAATTQQLIRVIEGKEEEDESAELQRAAARRGTPLHASVCGQCAQAAMVVGSGCASGAVDTDDVSVRAWTELSGWTVDSKAVSRGYWTAAMMDLPFAPSHSSSPPRHPPTAAAHLSAFSSLPSPSPPFLIS